MSAIQAPKSEFEVPVEYVDLDTGKKYDGTFTFKVGLSMADQQAIGRMRRQILGPNNIASLADEANMLDAQFQAEIQVRAIEPIPAFWSAKQGNDLPPELVRQIGEKMATEIQRIREQRAQQAEQARGQMRKAQS